jgi:CubicO group peptidase (beta-lactamase class C family)
MSSPPTVESAPHGRARFAAAHSLLEQAVAERAFPGAVYGALLHGEVVALDAVGCFTYHPASPAVTPATVFDLASLTKVVATTAMAMLLYDRGILQLDARLGDILPGFVIGMAAGSGKERVTLRSLLAHSSGLPGYAPLYAQHRSPEAMLRAALRLPLTALPDTRAEYSDIGFILLGKALEVLCGDLISRFFARHIAAPLGLKTARFCPPPAWHDLIPPTEDDRVFRRRILQGEVQDENASMLGGAAGHAGLFSNAADLLRFARCILNGGALPDGRPFFRPGNANLPATPDRPSTVALFTTRQTVPAGTSRTLGWDTPTDPSSSGFCFGPRSIGHLGYAGTSLWIDPDRSLAVVLLTNRTWPDRAAKGIQTVRPGFHDALVSCI